MSERTIGNYKPLHNLPPLAGVASLAGAAGPGLGVQACYRGPRLYDTKRTQAAVKAAQPGIVSLDVAVL